MYSGFSESTSEKMIGPVLPVGEPELRLIAISTINGSATFGGTSRQLGNATDHALLNSLRDWADVVLTGGRTVVAENYFGVRSTPESRARRTLGGQVPVAPIAVVSRTLELDPHAQLFTDTAVAPLLLVPYSALSDPALAPRRELLISAGAELISTGGGSPEEIIHALHQLGYHRISCEGGPGIYAMMFDANLVDVFHLTIDPRVQAPVEKPLFSVRPDGQGFSHALSLESVAATNDGTVFLRYRQTLSTVKAGVAH